MNFIATLLSICKDYYVDVFEMPSTPVKNEQHNIDLGAGYTKLLLMFIISQECMTTSGQ